MPDGIRQTREGVEAYRPLRRQVGLSDDEELPLRRIAVVGGGVGAVVPAEDEYLGVAPRLSNPRLPFIAAGLVGDRKARAGRGAVVGVPALPRRRLLDLDAKRPTGLLQVASPPIPSAQRPLRLQRHRHHLLDKLAADRITKERCAEGGG